jgi:LPS-assembly protein
VNGKRNVLTTTADFTGIAFLTEPRRFSPLQSKLRMRTTPNVDATWQLDYDTKKGRINSSTAFVDYHFGDYFLGGSHSFFHSPGEVFVSNPIPAPSEFNQFRFLMGYGGPSKPGMSASTGIGFDAHEGFLQYGSLQSSYNWDCCGLTMEYRRFALGRVRNENQFRFAFTLANIGTFGNLKRQERLF